MTPPHDSAFIPVKSDLTSNDDPMWPGVSQVTPVESQGEVLSAGSSQEADGGSSCDSPAFEERARRRAVLLEATQRRLGENLPRSGDSPTI